MYRPEGWKCVYLGKKANKYYELGADAMLEGLIRDSKKPVYRDGRKGITVFIPEDEKR